MNIPWEPAIYEHKAALIGKTPAEVSASADLLARALKAEHAAYRADFMTVGIDVYNVEAESAGALVEETGSTSCPEIRTPPFSIDRFEPPAPPDTTVSGRYPLLLEAARIARREIDESVALRIAASGPLSIAGKLVGIEPLVMALAFGDRSAEAVLDFAQLLCRNWLTRIRACGFDAIVFDSVAAPPVLSPALYHKRVRPRHRRIMEHLEALGQEDRPLVVGGDTTPTVNDIVACGATTVICDFSADAERFAGALDGAAGVTVRRNVDPALFSAAASVAPAAERLAHDLRFFARPIAGTGIMAYDADPDRFRRFRRRLRDAFR